MDKKESSEKKNIAGEKVKVEVEINYYDYKVLEELAKKEGKSHGKQITVSDLIRKIVYKELSFLSSTVKEQREIFDYWNSKEVIKHKNFTRCRRHISSALRVYKVEEIKQAIDNYVTVLNDERSYWNYKWDLISFLLRGVDRFLTCNKPLQSFRKFTGSKKDEMPIKYNKLT